MDGRNPPSARKVDEDKHKYVYDLMGYEYVGKRCTKRSEPAPFPPLPMQETKPRPFYEGETKMKKENAVIRYLNGRCLSVAFENSVRRLIREFKQCKKQFSL